MEKGLPWAAREGGNNGSVRVTAVLDCWASPHLVLLPVTHEQRFSAKKYSYCDKCLNTVNRVSSVSQINNSPEAGFFVDTCFAKLILLLLNHNLEHLRISNYSPIIHFNFSKVSWWRANPKIIFPGMFFKEILLYFCFSPWESFSFKSINLKKKNQPERNLKSWIKQEHFYNPPCVCPWADQLWQTLGVALDGLNPIRTQVCPLDALCCH